MSHKVIDILARTIYGEARGESISGQEAIANVVLNRLSFSQKKKRYWWGNDIISICQAPFQFSCWNVNDPNCKLIQKITEDDVNFCIAQRIATRAVHGVLEDNTCGATHYHTKLVFPKWSRKKLPCIEIGSHLFYNNIEE
ncbi:MAG: cell wall hydrolase [Alphaproteobacteria bacterium]